MARLGARPSQRRTKWVLGLDGMFEYDPRRAALRPFLASGNGYKIRLALRWLGIRFGYHEVYIVKGESRTPSFLAKNPFGQIPVREHDDGTRLRAYSHCADWCGFDLAPCLVAAGLVRKGPEPAWPLAPRSSSGVIPRRAEAHVPSHSSSAPGARP